MRQQTNGNSRFGQVTRPLGWVCALAVLAACGGKEVAEAGTTTTPVAAKPAVQTQPVTADPCAWLEPAAVESALGRPLGSVPVRVSSAETLTPSATGRGCLYQLKGEAGRDGDLVAVEVKTDGAEMQAGLGAASLGDFTSAKEASKEWDWVGGLPAGLFAARRGHLGIMVSIQSLTIGPGDVEPLALRVAAAVPDLPFEYTPGDASVAPTGFDPCSLLTRAEVEAVLGPLAQPPYRSQDSNPLVRGDGPACTWFAAGHRALVLTPTRSEGRMIFNMTSGISGLTAKVTGAAATTNVAGPWDARGTSPVGALTYLKGDQLLAFQHRASGLTDQQVNTLARLAIPRLGGEEVKP